MISLRGSILLSACAHVGILVAFLLISGPSRAKIIYTPQYEVRLVQPEEIPSLGKPKAPEPKPKPAPKVKKPQKKVVLPEKKKESKPEVKKDVKKPELPPPKKPEKKAPPKKHEKEALKDRADLNPGAEQVLDDVLARIKKRVGSRDRRVAKETARDEGGWEQRQKEIQYKTYHDQVYRQVRGNWIQPPELEMGGQGRMTVVSITLLPDGRIVKSYIEESSGDPRFDQSVMRAILKSSPLPPPPIGLEEQKYELGLRFFVQQER